MTRTRLRGHYSRLDRYWRHRPMNARRSIAALVLCAGFCGALVAAYGQEAKPAKNDRASKAMPHDGGVPNFKYDSTWPKLPLPNKWRFEGITGLTVDKDDVIWVLNRPGDFDMDPIFKVPERTENYASLEPPTAMCWVKPPAVLAFDQEGNLVRTWNPVSLQQGTGLCAGKPPAVLAFDQEGNLLRTWNPVDATSSALHLILADHDGNIWIGSNTMRKYTKDGKLLAEIPRVPESTVKPGQYPGDTQMVVGNIEGGEFDEKARELIFSDSYLRGRILVYDMDTLKFKRGWGAYGKPLSEISVTPDKYVPGGTPPKDFVNHLTLSVTRDGYVYAADRGSDRIQVFTEQGKFMKEFNVAPETLDRGSTGGLTFSPPPEQRYIYVSDIMNNVVWIVNRADGTTLGHFGFFGHSGGGFHWLPMGAPDSHGNVYTGEVDTGKRVQRFLVGR